MLFEPLWVAWPHGCQHRVPAAPVQVSNLLFTHVWGEWCSSSEVRADGWEGAWGRAHLTMAVAASNCEHQELTDLLCSPSAHFVMCPTSIPYTSHLHTLMRPHLSLSQLALNPNPLTPRAPACLEPQTPGSVPRACHACPPPTPLIPPHPDTHTLIPPHPDTPTP